MATIKPPGTDAAQKLRSALAALEGGAALQPLFESATEWLQLDAGEVLTREGERDAGLYLLIAGALDVVRAAGGGDAAAPEVRGTVRAPEIVGEMQLLTGGVRTATLRAAEPTLLASVPAEVFEQASRNAPELLRTLATRVFTQQCHDRLRRILPAFLDTSDPAVVTWIAGQVEWLSVARGDFLVREGDPGGDVFILVDGRLRAVSHGAGARALGDLVPGDVVGETQLFTGGRRNASVVALRNSVLARLPRARLEEAIRRLPDLGLRLASVAVERAQHAVKKSAPPRASVNIVIQSANRGIAEECARLLREALQTHGAAAEVSRTAVGRELGRPELCDLADDDPRAARLRAWLSEQETRQRFLIFVSEPSPEWSARCRGCADIILQVTTPDAAPEASAAPQAEAATALAQAKRWLVVLHEDSHRPRRTAAWGREVSRFFHIRRREGADFARLARALAGCEVGLVLGGGGARGYAHLGLIQAIEELGIPIDVLGGTSAGAAIAGCYALGYRGGDLEDTIKRWLGGSVDYTLPLVAISAGGNMLQRARQIFGELDLEDLALPLYCIATDITRFGMLVIERGRARDAVLASACLPGIFPPVLVDGRWAVDGGLVNAVPVDVMRNMVGPRGIVIGSDVTGGAAAARVEGAAGAAGVSGWMQLLRTLSRRPRLPSIVDVLQSSATAAGDYQLQRVIDTGRPDVCIRHDTAGYSIVDFSRPAPLRDKGYAASMEALRPLLDSGRLPRVSS
jgi:predicted acylesterase/phospholipase RssA/CRP-like cAMP-binding protein